MTLFSSSGWAVLLTVCVTLLAGAGCGGSDASLTDEQLRKLAPALQQVVQGEEPSAMADLPTQTRGDTTVYVVILRVSDAQAVRDAGIPLNSVQGPVATARLSVEQIRRAATLDAVTRIEPSGRARPMQ